MHNDSTNRFVHRGSRVVPVLTALALFVTSCGTGDPDATSRSSASSTSNPGGENRRPSCPALPVLDAPPKRIVTMDGAAAAVITDLGLGERIVGTAAPDLFAALPAEKKALLERIPVLDPGQGNAEKVIAADPDLVVGVSVYSFGGFDGTPSVDRLAQAGAAVVVACDSEARGTVKDLSATVRFVTGLAGVLGVEEAGRRLVREIQSSVDAVRADGRPPVRVLAISGPPAAGQTVMTQGGTSLANGVITLAGGANVAEDALTDFVSLSAEEIVARDPEAIVVVSGFSREGEAELAAAIRASAVLSRTTAVRENRIVVVPQSILLSPSTANGLAVRRIAEALRRPAS